MKVFSVEDEHEEIVSCLLELLSEIDEVKIARFVFVVQPEDRYAGIYHRYRNCTFMDLMTLAAYMQAKGTESMLEDKYRMEKLEEGEINEFVNYTEPIEEEGEIT